ncbi:MAG: hypothetical protein AB7G93_19795 [Bdellovibrionales bacterium]
MSYEFYKVTHIVGILMLFCGLAALWGVTRLGGTITRHIRVSLGLLHGIGMVVVLVSGFGLLARLGVFGSIPTWAWVKMGIWLLLGGSMVLAKRKSHWGISLILLWLTFGGFAAYLAINKPF